MCRNIKNLYNFDPPVTDEEIRAASTQFIRKVTGYAKPSQVNHSVMERAVEGVDSILKQLFGDLATTAQPRNRENEAIKAKLRSEKRFGTS